MPWKKAGARLLVGGVGLGAVACGAPSDGEGSPLDKAQPDEVAQVTSRLSGDVSTCLSAPPADSYWNITPGYRGDISSAEPVPNTRPTHCSAWVSQFSWASTTTAPKEYYFLGTSNPMPGDQTNCQGVWVSREIHAPFGSGWTTLQAGNYYATWDGYHCLWPNTPMMPSQCSGGCTNSILQLWNSSGSWQDWASTWTTVRVINQPFYIYWPIPAVTTLEVDSK